MRARRTLSRPAWLGLGALALAAVLGAVWLCGAFSPALDADAPGAMLTQAQDGLDSIVIEAALDVQGNALAVTQRLRLQNRTGQSQASAVLRAWPNAFQSPETSPAAAEEELYQSCYPEGFSAGALVISYAGVSRDGGAEAQTAHRYLDDAKTVLSVPVAGGWQPGEFVTVSLRYTVQIPRMAYRFGVSGGIWALGNCFAVPAVWENGAWRTDAYAPVGDPFYTDCANYTVTVTVPEGYVCAGSGWPTVETANGQSVYRFTSPAVRDFGLVISDRLHMAQRKENGVLLTAYATDASRAREMLGYAARALGRYAARFGAYPYPSYTLCEVDFPMVGMEYPAMAFIASSQLAAGGLALEYVTAHETAHQWWYAVVGSDPWNQSWQDEALSEYSVLCYWEDTRGRAFRDEWEQAHMEAALRVTVPRGVTPGAPLDRFSTMSEYSLVVYERGAAMLCALDRALPDGLDAALRAYYARYAFGRATREDFEALLRSVTGEDLSSLIRDYLDTYILN